MKKIFAHRGFKKSHPENTMEAFIDATALDIDGIEFDVHLTKDSIPIVFHDFNLKRMCTKSDYIGNITLKELRETLIYDHYHIPTLEETLEFLCDKNLKLNIEFKASSKIYPDIEKKTINLVSKYNLEDKVMYSSFDHRALKNIQNINPSAYTGALYNGFFNDIIKYAMSENFSAIHPHFLNIDETITKEAKLHNIDINCYTIDTITDYNHIHNLDITTIITNIPDLIIDKEKNNK